MGQEDAQVMGWGDRLLLSGISTGHLAALLPSWRAFVSAAERPWKTQADLLFAFLERHRDTEYGAAHGFGALKSVAAFQEKVPIVDYEALRPWIDRAAAGEPNVLSREPVRAFERSSGTTGGNKLIPYDPIFLAEFSRATAPWLFSSFATRPSLIGTSSYWSISPAARAREETSGGIPIGFADDTEYFAPIERWALRRMMAVPSSVAKIAGLDAWRFVTAQHLLSAPNLGFISVWNPSFLTLLMETIEARLGELLDTVGDRALQRRIDRDGVNGPAIWPRLRVISCWTDGHAERFVPEMARRFPGVEIEPKGLLATEGVVSIPLNGMRVTAIRSHFIEFEDLARPHLQPRLCDELEIGRRYAPILTTGNGFCRYRLSDEVECTGFFRRTPALRFIGKLDRISDLCGEKISAAEVDRALAGAGAFTFALLAPELDTPPRYRLYLEGGSIERAAPALEAALLENHHYRYCRALGQLGPVQAIEVHDGWRIYERTLIAQGMKAGDIKPTHLDTRTIWGHAFARSAD